jgi:hypothetical protein
VRHLDERRDASRARALAVLLALVCVAVARPVHADDVAVIVAPGPDDIDAATRTRALGLLVAALREAGQRAVAPTEVARRLEARGEAACASLECAPRVLDALDVAGVVELTLWSGARNVVREVVVSLVQRGESAESAGTAQVGRAGLDAALRTALAAARDGTGRRAGVRVRVTVEPDGAALTLDGRPLGRAPWEGVLPAGRHTIVAGHAGHDAVRRVVELVDAPVTVALRLPPEAAGAPADGSQASEMNQETVDVHLASVAASAASSSSGESGPRDAAASSSPASGTRPLLGPLLLGAAGLALVAVDVGALVMLGSEPPPGFARSLDPVPFALYGALGLGAAIGAVLWHVFGGDSAPASPRLARAARDATLALDF